MKYHRWTEEEIEFIRQVYPYHTNKDITEMLKAKFDIDANTQDILNLRQRFNFPYKKIPNSGEFKKGFTPWNKGKQMSKETKKKLERTWFQKGNITFNTLPVGTTRTTRDGYKEIKIAEPNVWALYQRYLYEQAHGEKLTKEDIILFADGDKTNFDIDNLVKVNRANLLLLNRRGLIFDDPELTKAGVNVSKLIEAMHKRKKEVKE